MGSSQQNRSFGSWELSGQVSGGWHVDRWDGTDLWLAGTLITDLIPAVAGSPG